MVGSGDRFDLLEVSWTSISSFKREIAGLTSGSFALALTANSHRFAPVFSGLFPSTTTEQPPQPRPREPTWKSSRTCHCCSQLTMTMPSPSHWAKLFGGQSAARPLLSPPPFLWSRRCRQFRNQDSSPQHTAPHLPSRCAERERAAFLRCHWGPLRFLAASLAAIAPWQEICAI